ncbi:SDR family NAD(P)-dependent oxidoreductase [Falsiroseomonas selenitidurans]|uniref:SDR family NAD(P)-dependent oxidoreductase n=1 Tax=Falsiroseomonas selenitidurans TaxID=2716335 RepID=A0ABX1ECE7_9PROT|nr:SDR family NAD(P)-dependent oxidoreductase [Falsiroseomonas selenitidurans]NKC34485.1 SDR family NAD(P)-dependent oxidoreductase [Falsiroseomonas selenitidurans]
MDTTTDWQGRRVVITGGSSGIGLELARQLAGQGARLLLAGRRPAPLAAAVAALPGAAAVQADVTDPAGRAALLDAAMARLGGVDVLVNNAGGVRAGRLEDMTEAELRAMVEVDLLAPILLTRLFLPALRASGDALVVNVASGLAQMGVPFYAGYAAAKAGLARFGEAMRRELKGEGVHVLTVFPGATDTPMMATSRADAGLGFALQPVAEVVAAIVQGMRDGAFEVVRGGAARQAMLLRNRDDPAGLDAHFLALKPRLEAAVRDHRAL